jgi:hypothetical protein
LAQELGTLSHLADEFNAREVAHTDDIEIPTSEQ